jgi:hypothetical protein
MRWARPVGLMGETSIYKILVCITKKGKRPLTRPSRRWECNIETYDYVVLDRQTHNIFTGTTILF